MLLLHFFIHHLNIPIMRTVLRMNVTIEPTFRYNTRLYGPIMQWWIWVEDSKKSTMYSN